MKQSLGGKDRRQLQFRQIGFAKSEIMTTQQAASINLIHSLILQPP